MSESAVNMQVFKKVGEDMPLSEDQRGVTQKLCTETSTSQFAQTYRNIWSCWILWKRHILNTEKIKLVLPSTLIHSLIFRSFYEYWSWIVPILTMLMKQLVKRSYWRGVVSRIGCSNIFSCYLSHGVLNIERTSATEALSLILSWGGKRRKELLSTKKSLNRVHLGWQQKFFHWII